MISGGCDWLIAALFLERNVGLLIREHVLLVLIMSHSFTAGLQPVDLPVLLLVLLKIQHRVHVPHLKQIDTYESPL